MRRHAIISILLLTLSTIAANALGSGFYSGDQSAAATGMATAVVASVNDASAVYFNPAALTELEGARVMGGVTVYDMSGQFNSDDGTSTELENSPIPLPHLYASWKASQKLAFGLGVFSDFGLATDWQDDWSGRFILGSTYAESMAVNFNPVIAYAINPRLSVAAGPVIRYFRFDLQNQIPNLLGGLGIGSSPAETPETGSRVEGDDWAYGFNLALKASLTDSIQVGISYRSETNHSLSGDFSLDDEGINGYTDASMEADVTLPAYADVGVAWQIDKWTLAAGVLWTQWSSYDALRITFDQPQGVAGINLTEGYSVQTRWEDTWSCKLGVAYELNRHWNLRTGIIYDPTPVPDDTLDPLVPVGDRLDVTCGIGYNNGPLHVGVAYLLVTSESRRFDNEIGDLGDWGLPGVTGEFDEFTTHALALSASYRF